MTEPDQTPVEETQPPDAPRGSGPLMPLLGLFSFEATLFLLLAAHSLDLPIYLTCHLSLCAATAIGGFRWVKVSAAAGDTGDKAMIVLQLVAWTVLAGPFGTLIATVLLIPPSAAASLTAHATAQSSEVTRLEMLHSALLDRRLRLEHAHTVRPLLDVVIEGTQLEKLDALSLISKRYSAALAPALRLSLEDKDSAVRVLAATVMAQQHNAYTKRIGALQAAARAMPENSARWSELAHAHSQYAESGLLDLSRADTERNQARAALARASEPNSGGEDSAHDGT